ncbi:geraniol 8-hydroxylase-like [Lolium rigidum]|uniref:geraniol 8-hydroxylase-like n=1 Tax=Lolium rigidum TaxID=89674 RepID=UPI001F5CEF52|nr:geraniol 8-hydroxylase-like [Lolium rigidum]
MSLLLAWLPWLVASLFSIYLLDLLANVRRCLPPGPLPLPLIGSLHLVGDQPHRSLARLAKRHGPLMSLRLGAVTTVVASSPDVAREFLQKHDAIFATRLVNDAMGDHARDSIPWLPHAPRWRSLRKMMATELFAPHRLDALQGLRSDKVRELAAHVARLASDGAEIDVGRVAFTTMLNLLSRTIFSRDLTSLDDHGGSKEFQVLMAEIMEYGGCPNVSDFFPALAWADLQGLRRRLARMFARLHVVFDEEVDRRREQGESRKENQDFLDVLVDVAARDGGKAGLDRDTLRALFTDLFIAGSDTSSITVEWAMVELLRNPSSMTKAHEEIAQVIGSGRSVEESDIDQLPYLQAVVKETFRLHPPAPFLLPRKAQETIKIAGYMVPQGARVLVNVWAIGRDEAIWPKPDKFMPERFIGREVDYKGGDFELLPFGAGRRMCPGVPLATRMVHLVLAILLNRFKWRLPVEVERAGIDMTDKFGVTLTKAIPLCAIAVPI